MGIVQLNGDLVRQRVPIRIFVLAEPAHDVVQRTDNQEVLLQKPQPSPRLGRIVGVQHSGQRCCGDVVQHCAHEIAGGKVSEVETVRGSCRPEAQGVDTLTPVADHRPVVGDAEQVARLVGHEPEAATLQGKRSVQRDLDGLARPGHLPRIWPAQPVVGLLHLMAALDRLLEYAVLVTQTIAHRRDLHGSHRVNEAGRRAGPVPRCPARRRVPAPPAGSGRSPAAHRPSSPEALPSD